MIQASISRLIKDRGFGFAEDELKKLYFFHYSAFDPKLGVDFASLTLGQKIEFLSEDTEKGPRAIPRTMRILPQN